MKYVYIYIYIYVYKLELLIYRESRWPLSTIKRREKTPPKEQDSRQGFRSMACIFTLKFTPLRRPPQIPLVKTNHPVSPQMEHWNGLKCVNITYTGNII